MPKKYNLFVIQKEYSIMLVKHKDLILEVKIDTEDIEKVREVGAWHAIYDKTLQTPNYYICNRRGETKKLHRLIMDCPRDKVVDHINHDTLDNRKQNLRICTVFENQQNLRSKRTGQTGVYYRTRGIWCANITKDKNRYYKEFKSKEEAIKWRKEQEIKLYNYKGVI